MLYASSVFASRRRRLRYDDIVVVEEAALRRAIFGSVVGNIMEWYDVGVYAYVAVLVGRAFLVSTPASRPSWRARTAAIVVVTGSWTGLLSDFVLVSATAWPLCPRLLSD